jgi:adenylate cyclase
MTRGLLLRERYRAVLSKVVSQDVAEELMKGDVELGGESRLVTVIFADIRGFTPLTEGMEPQEVIGLLNECMEYLSQAIDAEGGVVDKFIGDAVMAVFGAPAAQDDHARRAVRAAIRMRVAMATFNAIRASRGDEGLAIGVGVNSGVAVAGNMGSSNRMNYTVVGDVVNLASRLSDQAQPGEILIGGSTLSLAGPGLKASPLGGRALKGFSAEVEVYSVEALTDTDSGEAFDSSRASA